MTDQSPNDGFKASSFQRGHNAGGPEQLYVRHASDPKAVDDSWKSFFDQFGDGA